MSVDGPPLSLPTAALTPFRETIGNLTPPAPLWQTRTATLGLLEYQPGQQAQDTPSEQGIMKALQSARPFLEASLTEAIFINSESFTFEQLENTVLIELRTYHGTTEFGKILRESIIVGCIIPYITSFFELHGKDLDYAPPHSLVIIIQKCLEVSPGATQKITKMLHDILKRAHGMQVDHIISIITRLWDNNHRSFDSALVTEWKKKNSVKYTGHHWRQPVPTTEEQHPMITEVSALHDQYEEVSPGETLLTKLICSLSDEFYGELEKKHKVELAKKLILTHYRSRISVDIKKDLYNTEGDLATSNTLLQTVSEATLEACRFVMGKNTAHRLCLSEYLLSGLGYEGALSEVFRASSHKNDAELQKSFAPIASFMERLSIRESKSAKDILSVTHHFLCISHAINLICLTYAHDSPYVKAILFFKEQLVCTAARLKRELLIHPEFDKSENLRLLMEVRQTLNTIEGKAIINYTWLARITGKDEQEIRGHVEQLKNEMSQAYEMLMNDSSLTKEEKYMFENVYRENMALIEGFGEMRISQLQTQDQSTTKNQKSPHTNTFQSPQDHRSDKVHSPLIIKCNVLIQNIKESPFMRQCQAERNILSEKGKALVDALWHVQTSEDFILFFQDHFPLSREDFGDNSSFQRLVLVHILPSIVHILNFSKHFSNGIDHTLLKGTIRTVIATKKNTPGIELYVNIGTAAIESLRMDEISKDAAYTELIDTVRSQLDTSEHFINEMPGIPRLYLALSQFYARLSGSGDRQDLEKAAQCLAIYIFSCAGNVPNKYQRFVNDLYRDLGNKQITTGGSDTQITRIGLEKVRSTIMRIINTNIKKAQGILEGFFRDATDGQIPDVNQQILLINCLCKELSIELFSHEEGMILVKDTRQIRIPDAWEKEVITIPCENGDAYYLVFPFPTLKRDTFLGCDTDELEANSVPDVEAFHGQFREYHGEILRLVDKITRSLGRYDKQSGLYNAAYITQLHEHPEYSRKYDFYRMTLGVKNGSNAILPSIGEVQACIRDCLRGIGNGIIPGFSRTTHTFLFAIPKGQTINPRDYFGGYLKSFPHVRPSFTPLDR